jgi:hypothetical protein
MAFAIVRYCLDKGIMDSKRWEFKIKNDRKIGKKTVQLPIPLLSDSHLNHKSVIQVWYGSVWTLEHGQSSHNRQHP